MTPLWNEEKWFCLFYNLSNSIFIHVLLFRKLIKSLELRIHNLEEQKAFLLSSSGSADKELAKKDEQLKSAREKLDVKNIAYKMLEGK